MTMPHENSPLLTCGLSSLLSGLGQDGQDEPLDVDSNLGDPATSRARSLNTFFGVIVPTVLSMFSIVLFLRTGFVIGHAGLFHSLIMLGVAYVIISMTILSICAISTNGAIQAGGAYFMISRSLGPEFGGSIGLMFYLANVCGCGVYVLGLVEAILDSYGQEAGSSAAVLPGGYWFGVLYSSVVLLVCMLVCLVGSHLYTRASFLILLVVTVTLLSVIISTLVLGPIPISLNHPGETPNSTHVYNTSYTGFNLTTLKNNLKPGYTLDYSTSTIMTFASVFAVMFNGCTGIMAGANMSGELKNPSVSIPKGTIIAVAYTFIVYLLFFLLVSSTCDRVLLVQDYGFLRRVNVWPPFVTLGIYCSALSAAMSTLIGASRILHALALDQLFGRLLAPASITTQAGNPWVAVLYTWALVQCVVFAGQLNSITSLVTVFYLLAYAAVDLACLALEWASAPNFRPTFQFFSWHSCLLGIVGSVVMMFVIEPLFSSASIALLLLLLLFIHYRSATSSWGYISQALIFHQVRKYLLMLDVRKEHVKFWRPQVLLMVSNPRSSCQLISFVNQLKKGGLFVLGHVHLGDLDSMTADPVQAQYQHWLSLVDLLEVKAFVDLTLSSSVRQGTQHLLRITGLGGMKPNTLILGFYDNCVPDDYFLQDPVFYGGASTLNVDLPSLQAHFPPVRNHESPWRLGPEEYVGMVRDAIKMGKNVCLARYFHQLQPLGGAGVTQLIDVWPLNLLRPESGGFVDVCSLFLLQLACVLNMAAAWRHARMRIFLCVEADSQGEGAWPGAGWLQKEAELRELLQKLRIRASIQVVMWEVGTTETAVMEEGGGSSSRRRAATPGGGDVGGGGEDGESGGWARTAPHVSPDFLLSVNDMLRENSAQADVRFLYLPRPPAPADQSHTYLAQLEAVTHELGPTLLVHGLTPVTCTEL
ncbi:solute carrier family 12 member 9-like isoform X1 [Alosa pseudoharengus]|uniref:solute carrier family 12 member 9-like isoform X1 n=1 Tax=Alosa pseudoharengus TaxID=34774 RepID=UPI003F8C799D